jgi:hypothetical protein
MNKLDISTRATIEFREPYPWGDTYYVCRHCGGFPENIVRDFNAAFKKSKGRWSGQELGFFVTLFLAMHYNYNEERLPGYEITSGFHGNECYKYYVEFDDVEKEWHMKCNDWRGKPVNMEEYKHLLEDGNKND